MKTINKIYAVVLLLLFSSCKDFLDVQPTDSGDSSTSLKTPEDAQVLMNGLMREMTSSNYYGRNFVMYGDAKGGDLTILQQGRGLDPLYNFNHTVTTNNYSGFWSTIYTCILQTNSLIENIEALENAGSTEDFSAYKGQALTARALMYYDLVRLYGKSYNDDKTSFGVPNVTTVLQSTAQPLRATVEENYNQIVNDLTAAADLLPKSKSDGFINYYANLAIQARVYLSMEEYDKALAAADEIIKSNVYTLYSNENWVDSWKAQYGSESIFELGVFPNEADLGTASLGFYLRRKGHGSTAAAGWFMASDYYLDRLGQDPEDVRWGVMSYDETSKTRLGSCYKYNGSVNLEGDKEGSSTAVNIKVIRLSEVYLIAAEAALNTDKALATEYLNAIRKRSPNLAPATTANITLDMILDEKSKELFGEGQRFFDLIRLNKSITFNDDFGGIPTTYRKKTIDRAFYKTILPISQDEINANPAIGAQQNPDY